MLWSIHSPSFDEGLRALLNQSGTALTGFMRRIDREIEVLNVADSESLEKTSLKKNIMSLENLTAVVTELVWNRPCNC